jgi:hypothetical protein
MEGMETLKDQDARRPSKRGYPVMPACALVLTALALSACDPMPELRRVDLGDVRPPTLLGQTIADDGRIRLVFDEAVILVPDSLRLTVGPPASSPGRQRRNGGIRSLENPDSRTAEGTEISFEVTGPTEPGREYALEAAVRDSAGNSLNVVLPFYGPNPQPADLAINELQTRLSVRNRDALELLVRRGGNLGGITVFLGVPLDFDASFTFPDIEVATGDYLVLHCKPEGKPGEVDETGPTDRADGPNCLPGARDFWWRGAPGLPDETGIVTLAGNPLGSIKDAVFYTNKATVAGKDWRSFGTRKMMDRADALLEAGAWSAATHQIAPEDGCRSAGLTSTRSLCRDSGSRDSDSAADWHIVPTRKATIGSANSDEKYQTPATGTGASPGAE